MSTVIIQTAKGMATRFDIEEIRTTGKVVQGVGAIKIADNDYVVGAIIVNNPVGFVMTVTENGYAKISPITDYHITHRGGKGYVSHKVNAMTGDVVSICEV